MELRTKQMRVLLVDDETSVIQCLRQLIDWEDIGCEVVGEAYNGEDAYKEAVEKKPDVIISDIKMPFSDGTELVKKIRESMLDVEIIFLSAYEDFSVAQLALQYGVREYILKPVNMKKIEELSKILRQLKANMDRRNSLERLLGDPGTDADILDALKNSDLGYFEELFDSLTGNGVGDTAITRVLCQRLINVLYEYFRFIGVSAAFISKRWQKIKDEIECMETVRDAVLYTRNLYLDVMQFEGIDRDKYHKALIDDVQSCIHEYYTDKLFGVSFVARKFNFSINHIGKLFKQYTGMAISAYITETRVKKAAGLLRDTALSVSEIADTVGYSSSGYFTKVFKAAEGVAPAEYRMKMKLNKQKLSE